MNSLSFAEIFRRVKKCVRDSQIPSVSEIAGIDRDPYQILISTVLSLRTKDNVTAAAARRLFDAAATPEEMIRLPEKRIQELIYPAGFYRVKAQNIRSISQILLETYNGEVPRSQEALMELPGVGLKTANLTLSLGFQLPYICVDTHVHRISNRLGWVETKTPIETERTLQTVLPKKHWIEINELFVRFGQSVCTPQSPRCSECPLQPGCPRIGVQRSR
ncbi:MAG: endonuclease III [Spirochaetota bacterium]|nr:endonuclease III [Spirochaetota bacterium]